MHKDDPRGYVGREDWSADLCHWKDGWGPLAVSEYSTDECAESAVIERMTAQGWTCNRATKGKAHSTVFADPDLNYAKATAPGSPRATSEAALLAVRAKKGEGE